MTYVTDQTSQELRAHMRRLKAMAGWHEPLADRLYKEILELDETVSKLRAAQAAQPAQNEWTVMAPDGTRFTGPTPLKAALTASRHRLETDPVAAAKFMEVIEQERALGEAENAQCMRDYGTLDCPHCGGSGHIADAMAAQPAHAHAIDTSPERVEKQAGNVQVPDGWKLAAWLRYDGGHVVLEKDRHNYSRGASERFNIPLYAAPSTKEQSNG